MNPRYGTPRKNVPVPAKQTILSKLGSNPSEKAIAEESSNFGVKEKTIRSWLKTKYQKHSNPNSDEESVQPFKKKIKRQDDDEWDNLHKYDEEYLYKLSQQNQECTQEITKGEPQPEEKVRPVMKQYPTQQQQKAIQIQQQVQQEIKQKQFNNFGELLNNIKNGDGLLPLIQILYKFENQIDELQRTRSEILKYFQQHLKESKKI